jgi:hypothetical protein
VESLSAERKRGGLGPFAARFWLVAALFALIAGLILGANLALLGYAQPRNDPVGQLTPARLMQAESELPENPATLPTTVTTSTTVTTLTTSTVTVQQPPTRTGHQGEHDD